MKNQLMIAHNRKLLVVLAAMFLLSGLAFAGLTYAQGSVNQIVVNSLVDDEKKNDGMCTLREAVISSNRDRASGGKNGECASGRPDAQGPDTIVLPSGVYTLTRTDNGSEDSSTTGDLDITSNIVFQLTGSGPWVIEGGSGFTDRIFHILPGGKLTIDRATIRGGSAKFFGGAFFVDGGELNLSNSTLTGNRAGTSGGAVYNNGKAVLNYVTVKNNTIGNTDPQNGGGLANSLAVSNPNIFLTLNNSYIDNNRCAGFINGDAAHNLARNAANCNASLTDSAELLVPFPKNPAVFELPQSSNGVDAGSAPGTTCPATDQDGKARPQGQFCDVGAFEADEKPVAPVAGNQSVTVSEDVAKSFNLVVSDANGIKTLNLNSFQIITSGPDSPANGTLTNPVFGPANEVTVTYTPDTHYDGPDSFSYKICDTSGLCSNVATVSITVEADAFLEVTNACDSNGGSLRNAINIANAGAGSDTIVFDIINQINTCGTDTIKLKSPLPPLSAPVVIDGQATDGNFSPANPRITLTPDATATTPFAGVTVLAGANGSTIANLIITGFAGDGIYLEGTGVPGTGSTIQGNTIANNGRNGITIGDQTTAGDGNTVMGNIINNNCGSGILIFGLGADSGFDAKTILGNQIEGNTITNNGACGLTYDGTPTGMKLDDGVTIATGLNNEIVDNDISGNEDLPVDIGGDGRTANDTDDPDSGPNYEQNYPVLLTAPPGGNIGGLLNSVPSDPDNGIEEKFTLQFFTSASCDENAKTPLQVTYGTDTPTDGAGNVITGSDGTVRFTAVVDASTPLVKGNYVISTATDMQGNTSEYSVCLLIDNSNIVWPRSWPLLQQQPLAINALNPLGEIQTGVVSDQTISEFGQSKWFKFEVGPDSKITLDLTNLSVNLDLSLYKDIEEAYAELIGTAIPDLEVIGAEFAPDAFAPDAFAPDAFAPDAFAPDAFAPDAFAPDAFAPDAFAPDAFAPDAFAPDAFAPDAFAPDAFAPDAFALTALEGNAYSSAQSAALIGVSTFDGLAPERLSLRTFNSAGTYYVRVKGRQGTFDPLKPFTLSLNIESGQCNNLDTTIAPYPVGNVDVTADYKTLILVDETRLGLKYPGQVGPGTDLNNDLQTLAGVVDGKIINVGADPQVIAKNAQADSPGFVQCVTAKNMVAESIKAIVDAYRNQHDIEYLVIVGNDDVIPFFRHPDLANLGPEEDYEPPLQKDPLNSSETQLRSSYFLSQDKYGSSIDLNFKNDELPLPEIATGRLLETPGEIMTVIDAYLGPDRLGNITVVPDKAASVGYDFMSDVAGTISQVMSGTGAQGPSTGLPVVELISDTWTSSDLVNLLGDVNNDPDIAFLAGHYSANTGVAADYKTYFYPTDVLQSPQDFTNNLFFSNGCHSGYNIVNEHDEPWTRDPDWAQAFARRGATLIAGTGYQYGDTDFIEYNERLYLEFIIALRNGQSGGAISIGDALVKAKQEYLNDTAVMRGIHQKSLLQSTIFGLPMLKVDMPGNPLPVTENLPLISGETDPDLTAVSSVPGSYFNLHTFDLVREYVDPNSANYQGTLDSVDVALQNLDPNPGDPSSVLATYLKGPFGKVLSNVGQPVLPWDEANVTIPSSNLVLRGIGFRGGDYQDFMMTKYVLMGSAVTEVSGAHFNFLSNIFFPPTPWSINRFDALTDTTSSGNTMLNIFPAQHQADIPEPAETTLRKFDNMEFRLFYSDFTAQTGPNLPALAMAPSIVKAQGTDDTTSVTFNVWVVGDPSAGIQEVWVTYTNPGDPSTGGTAGNWVSLDLEQDPDDSTLWKSNPLSLPTGTVPGDLRFIAQACSGTGLCSMSDNFGRYYIPGNDGDGLATAVTGLNGPSSGAYNTEATFSATLVDENGTPLGGLPVFFSLGQETRFALTSNDAGDKGQATVTIPLLGAPGTYKVNAWFPGNAEYATSAALNPLDFAIEQQTTNLSLQPATIFIGTTTPDVAMYAELTDGTGKPLAEKTVIFTLQGAGSVIKKAVITDQEGRARLGALSLPQVTTYSVGVQFGGTSAYLPSSTSPTAGTLETVKVLADGKDTIWPTNNKMLNIEIVRSSGSPLGFPYRFLLIEQDEEVTGGPDATISADCTAATARAERDGNGNGRVYHILYEIAYDVGTWIPGEAFIATIPHDQGGDAISVNDGPPYHLSATCNN